MNDEKELSFEYDDEELMQFLKELFESIKGEAMGASTRKIDKIKGSAFTHQ